MLQVDLRYASIQEEDISIYVIIKGFVISNVSIIELFALCKSGNLIFITGLVSAI